MKISLFQFSPYRKNVWKNFELVKQAVEESALQGSSIIVLPELWASGPLMEPAQAERAAAETAELLPELQQISQGNNLIVVGGLCVKEQGMLYNSQVFSMPDGYQYEYRKIHLFPLFREPEIFTPGKGAAPVSLGFHDQENCLAGPMICYDIRFPELARHLVRHGASVLIVSALWPMSRIDNFELLCRARAMESQVFLVAANGTGRTGGLEFGGNSLCCGPDGGFICRTGKGDGLHTFEISLPAVKQRRALFSSALSPKPWELNSASKIVSLAHLKEMVNARRAAGQKMAFTNGCFDILHAGHVSYLEKARSQGDFLVVGLNSDRSVQRIKGPERPVNPEEQRARVLAALGCVDYVILFQEETPKILIEALVPDILVKGADWPEDQIVGADFVKRHGGRVERIEFEVDISTTAIIERVSGRN